MRAMSRGGGWRLRPIPPENPRVASTADTASIRVRRRCNPSPRGPQSGGGRRDLRSKRTPKTAVAASDDRGTAREAALAALPQVEAEPDRDRHDRGDRRALDGPLDSNRGLRQHAPISAPRPKRRERLRGRCGRILSGRRARMEPVAEPPARRPLFVHVVGLPRRVSPRIGSGDGRQRIPDVVGGQANRCTDSPQVFTPVKWRRRSYLIPPRAAPGILRRGHRRRRAKGQVGAG